MKKCFILYITLLAQIIFSQENIKVVYSTSFAGEVFKKDGTKENEIFVNQSTGSEKEISTLEFILEYDGNKSLFKSLPKLEHDNDNIGNRIGKIIAAYDCIYFKDFTSENSIEELSLGGKRYYVKNDFERYKWETFKEEKKIQNFNCYLAKTYYNGLDVYAWYCPNLPYAVGPRDYSGLPGLILELQVGKLIFLAKSIDFPKNIDIEYDTKNIKTVTPEEMKKTASEFMQKTLNTLRD